MKKYEFLDLEIQSFSDVITTSADVTTGEIPWKNTSSVPSQTFELTAVSTSLFELD